MSMRAPKLARGTEVWYFCHVQSGAGIGCNCSLGQNVNVASNVKIGDGVKICRTTFRCTRASSWPTTCSAGPFLRFHERSYSSSEISEGECCLPAHSSWRKEASIGANATIVCGHEIGSWALIGAGAVVGTDVPARALHAGGSRQA